MDEPSPVESIRVADAYFPGPDPVSCPNAPTGIPRRPVYPRIAGPGPPEGYDRGR